MTPEEIERYMGAVRGQTVTTLDVFKVLDPDTANLKGDYMKRRHAFQTILRKLRYLRSHGYIERVGLDPESRCAKWRAIE